MKLKGLVATAAGVTLLAGAGIVASATEGKAVSPTASYICQHVITNQKPLPYLLTTPGVNWRQSVYKCDPTLDADGKFNRWERWTGSYYEVGGELLRVRTMTSIEKTSSTRFHEEAHWVTATWSDARREQVRKALGVNYWATPTPGVPNLDYYNSGTEIISRSAEGCYAGRSYNQNNRTRVIKDCSVLDSLLAGKAVPATIAWVEAGLYPLPARAGYLPPMDSTNPSPTPGPGFVPGMPPGREPIVRR